LAGPFSASARPSREIVGKSLWPSTQLIGRFEFVEVLSIMSDTARPTGHLQVKLDWNGRTRSFYAFWRDQNDQKGGCRLGPAHVRDSGRKSPRGATIWRAGNGPRPTPEHLTPKDAQEQLDAILSELVGDIEDRDEASQLHTLFDATQGWVAERH